MTLALIFLGWFILSSLWGFLPLVEPLRLFAITTLQRRKITASVSGLLAFLTGTLTLLWIICFYTTIIVIYDSHAASASQAGMPDGGVDANILPVANEIMLRQFLPAPECLSKQTVVCDLAAQVLRAANLRNMLPALGAGALIPALAAAFICWKLMSAPQPNPA